jgi:CBS domain-containing protein
MRRIMNLLHLSSHTSSPRPLRPIVVVPAVKPGDAAVAVMTDFAHEQPITVGEERRIEDALEDMIRFGVRALLVCRGDTVTGLITSYDVQGERPMKFLQSSTYTRHDEILVGHVMTPWEEVPVLDWEEVCEATVSDVLALFRETDATHLPVLQTPVRGSGFVRGLISRARLERQLTAAA